MSQKHSRKARKIIRGFQRHEAMYQGTDNLCDLKIQKELLKMMSRMIAFIKEPKTLQITLEQLLGDFDRLHAYAELRPRIFQLIGSIKMGLL